MHDPRFEPRALSAAHDPRALSQDVRLREAFKSAVWDEGYALLRDLNLGGPAALGELVRGLGRTPIGYRYASTPRTALGGEVYTATEYPAHVAIPLHNEQSYTGEWPLWLWFYCARPADTGGLTPIADSRRILAAIDTDVRARFQAHGLLYIRNYGQGLDLPWQAVFGVDDPGAVEAFCAPRGIRCLWSDDGELRTEERCQAVARHPRTGEMVWFNQAHLFHPSALAPEIREALLEAVDEEDLPRNVRFGDGGPIPQADLDHIREVIDQETRAFDWRAGDLLMLDNMRFAHGRTPFEGPRSVLVAMADPHGDRLAPPARG